MSNNLISDEKKPEKVQTSRMFGTTTYTITNEIIDKQNAFLGITNGMINRNVNNEELLHQDIFNKINNILENRGVKCNDYAMYYLNKHKNENENENDNYITLHACLFMITNNFYSSSVRWDF